MKKESKKSSLHKIFLKSSSIQAGDLNLLPPVIFRSGSFEQQIAHALPFLKSPLKCFTHHMQAFSELLLNALRFFNGKFYKGNESIL
jgi:hypothetical protein